jgi:two-component system invasion response regulator UvrY
MIKILIADDHAIVREGLKQIVSESPDLVVVAEACTGQEVLD